MVKYTGARYLLVMRARRHIAACLAAVLLTGLVVAPLTHYVWMSMDSHYAPPTSAGSGQHGSETPSGMSMPTVVHMDGIGVERAHLKCDYSGLFATSVAVASTSPSVSAAITSGSALVASTQRFQPGTTESTDQPRAPPQA